MVNRPPFRADQVGSLLRPQALVDARARFKSGEINAEQLRKHEDEAIRAAVARQESIGLKSVTDGEFRRDYWHIDFLRQLQGVEIKQMAGPKFVGTEEQPPIATVVGKLDYARPVMVDDFKFLQSVAQRTPKQTIPSPSMLHMRAGRKGVSSEVYPDIGVFWADAAATYRKALASFSAAGCKYLQLDDVAFAYLGDEKFRESCRANGDDPKALPRRYADTINAALKGRPADLAVTIHTCHGNFKSSSATQGGYEDIAEAMFSCDVDGFFMEFDNERSGSFEPLRLLPKNKKVVLGLVTTKVGQIESKDELKRSIDVASKYVPLENLCISPQCGFASTHHGNLLSENDQWRKLALVAEVADEVWGSR
ncbi:MAG TPA: 5-methyltetrahydropteroyltriglutamate--homocysteine S-methyltransferase [Steroidobacteraceae bacterium]|nr:5-methyltetrahydropteroyltriglutamate--homocysteine S-methyltransferase [Steroidobacteraceae bacterium]